MHFIAIFSNTVFVYHAQGVSFQLSQPYTATGHTCAFISQIILIYLHDEITAQEPTYM